MMPDKIQDPMFSSNNASKVFQEKRRMPKTENEHFTDRAYQRVPF